MSVRKNGEDYVTDGYCHQKRYILTRFGEISVQSDNIPRKI